MKNLIFLTISLFFTLSKLPGQDGTLKPYSVKSGILEYKYSGDKTGKDQKVIHENYKSFYPPSDNWYFSSTFAQKADPYKPDNCSHAVLTGMTLVWNDEFNSDGKPDPSNWRYETGFVRNQELQWYQKENANCKGGVLKISSPVS